MQRMQLFILLLVGAVVTAILATAHNEYKRLEATKELVDILDSSISTYPSEPIGPLVKERGAGIASIGPRSRTTLLMLASLQGRLDMVDAALAHGVDINGYDIQGFSALSYAVLGRRGAVIEKLVSSGARLDPDIRDFRGDAFLMACESRQFKSVSFMAKYAPCEGIIGICRFYIGILKILKAICIDSNRPNHFAINAYQRDALIAVDWIQWRIAVEMLNLLLPLTSRIGE
jgi:hypothetical protein